MVNSMAGKIKRNDCIRVYTTNRLGGGAWETWQSCEGDYIQTSQIFGTSSITFLRAENVQLQLLFSVSLQKTTPCLKSMQCELDQRDDNPQILVFYF